MKILFKDAEILGYGHGNIAVDGEYIAYVGSDMPEGNFDRVIDCKNKMAMPGLYNCHTHAAMTLFRGYGEDLSLSDWLHTRIFPAEDRLTNKAVYDASLLAAAEMIKGGTVSCSDMYFFCDQTVDAFIEAGIKANISRSIVSFDPTEDFSKNSRVIEAKELFEKYHNAANGRIKIDMALHAEYTNVAPMVRYLSDYAAKVGARMHVHLSETESEHSECIIRHGYTPARFFSENGAFDIPALAAHCVYVSDDDIALMAEKGVTAVHNPASNLKLGSGVMPLASLRDGGVNVALGTDGAASNNALDMMREMYLAAILHKGINRDTVKTGSADAIKMATVNGAIAQGRGDCGSIEEGKKADIVLLDLDSVHNIPSYDLSYTVAYSANSSDVRLTMVDGKILYENGEFTTLDIERVKYEMKNTVAHYFD